jgi:hypothetical protein
MMYTETELENVKKQLAKIIILITAIFLAVFIPCAAFLLRKPVWIGTTVMTIGVFAAIFLWGIYGTPMFHYYRYLKDIFEGRTREIKGKVIRADEKPVYKDNRLLYHEVWIIDDEDGEERVLLFDDNKGKPSVQTGMHYTFRIHENFITQITES